MDVLFPFFTLLPQERRRGKGIVAAPVFSEHFEDAPDALDLPVVRGNGDILTAHIVGKAGGHIAGNVAESCGGVVDPGDELVERRFV